MRWAARLLASMVLLGGSGCAFYTPYEIKSYSFDWNSERQLNAHIEKFDRLPYKPLRIRLMRLGYNIGPAGQTPMPVERNWMERMFPGEGRNGPRAMWNELPPIPPEGPTPLSNPTLSDPQLPLIPPAPPADLSDPLDEFVPPSPPAASTGPTLQPAAYLPHRNRPPQRVSNAAWMFTSPR